MVRKARNYLYLVDQFANYPDAFAEVAAALPHLKAVIILANDQDNPTFLSDLRHHVQYPALGQLIRDPNEAKKVHIFKLVREKEPNKNIYVHSKIFIADDEYMVIGSCGLERSGFTNDLVMMAGICDPSNQFVKKYRKKIWAEHLRLEDDNPILEDPMDSLKEWIRQADTKKARVQHYFPKNTGKSILEDLYLSLYETDGRCYN
jgi:phosphatidylserine/phosphatidylglycerophosphate/cardiolipin synthase-like enzyme